MVPIWGLQPSNPATMATMRAEGLEPPRAFAHRHLKPARVPIPPRPRPERWSILRPRRPLDRPESAPRRRPEQVSSALVAQVRNIRPGYTVIRPNRDKASCKATKAVVVLIMIVSIALMLALTIGGWSELEGLKPVNFVWCIVYAVIGFYIWRWARGLLPIAAALAVLLLIIA